MNENHRRRCIYHVPSIVPLFQKFQKIFKKCVNSLNVKRSASQVKDIILGTCMKFKNYPMKIVDVFFGHYILYHCFKNFKKSPKIQKNSLIVKTTCQVNDILDACIKLEKYSIKTVRGDAFYRHFILCYYLKNNQKTPKYKDNSIVKRITGQASDITLDACMTFEYYLIQTVGKMYLSFTIYYTIISKFQ